MTTREEKLNAKCENLKDEELEKVSGGANPTPSNSDEPPYFVFTDEPVPTDILNVGTVKIIVKRGVGNSK